MPLRILSSTIVLLLFGGPQPLSAHDFMIGLPPAASSSSAPHKSKGKQIPARAISVMAHHLRLRTWRKMAGSYAADIAHASIKTGLPKRLLAAVVHVETRGKPGMQVSSAGAIGPMQLMPHTAWVSLRVNPWDPRENIEGGARYLKRLLKRFGGNMRLALVAYNAGPTQAAAGEAPQQAWHYADTVLELAG